MLKRLISLLATLSLLSCMVCVSAFASYETSIDADTADNDALLEGYVEQLFSIDSGIALASDYGSEYLDDVNLVIYTALKSAVCDIASGAQSSPVITLNLTYSCAELGASNFNTAVQAFQDSFNSSLIYNYLLYDCPYEMYWHDKTTGMATSLSCSGNNTQLTVKLTFTFAIAADYQSEDGTEVDASKAAAAVAAAENAQEIAAKYDELSDYDKLTAYKDEICALVSYNEDYATADFGDIWQLVWVFDGDEATNVVCEGYSKAFQYLCDLSYFDNAYCYTVSGIMAGGTGAGGHMWNVVSLNGVSYMVDVTNSDSGTVGQDGRLFMVCADDALQSSATGYSFLAGSTTITYAYDSTTLALYSASVTTLGSAADTDAGDTGTEDTDTGDTGTGDTDTGDTDTGDTDTGDTGTGDTDTGDTDSGDTDTGDTGDSELIQLAAPTDLEWGVEYTDDGALIGYVPGMISFTVNAPTQNEYEIDIYKVNESGNDTCVLYSEWELASTVEYTKFSAQDFLELDTMGDDVESGIYYFTVQALGDGVSYSDSEICVSETWTYEKPTERLPAVTGLTLTANDSNDSPVTAMWDAMADTSNLYEYYIDVAYSESSDGDGKEVVVSRAGFTENYIDIETEDFYSGTGYYFFRVKAISNDITSILNSEWSEWSEPYRFEDIYSAISDTLAAIDEEATADEIKETVQSIDTSELAAAMTADTENVGVAAQIADLEAQAGTSTTVTVTATMADSFDSAQISVVGGGLNTTSGSAELTIDAAKDGDVIDTQYKNSVAFSMTLTGEDVNSTELSVPVKITLPIPSTINPEFLVILHYHSGEEEPEELRYPVELYIYEENGQYYVSFVITSFSDFVMYEESGDTGDTGDTGDSGDSGDTGDSGDDSGSSFDAETAAEAIESIISSVAAGTQDADADNSSYDESLDLNDDGKNDLLDILSILYDVEEESAAAEGESAAAEEV